MRPVPFVLLLLLTLSIPLFAFDISPYLYDGETAASVTTQNVTSDAGSYTLYSISGVPSFLVDSDGNVVKDTAILEATMRDHFQRTLLPSPDELKGVRDQLLSFNASRNLRSRFGPIEDVCLGATALKALPCNTTASCDQTAHVVCTLASVGGAGGCYESLISPPILAFSLAVASFNSDTAAALSDLSTLTLDNVGAQLSGVQTRISSLKASANIVASSTLRFPELGDKCPEGGNNGCIGICPTPHLDVASLDAASAGVTSLTARLGPISSLASTARQISSATAERLDYRQSSAQAAVWAPKWKTMRAKYSDLQINASSLIPYNKDSNFTAAMGVFQSKWNAIDARVAARNFSGIETDFAALGDSVPALQAAVAVGTRSYRDTRVAQNHVSDVLAQVRWRVAGAADKPVISAYNSLASRKNALDANFTPPLASAQYLTLMRGYSALETDARKFLVSQGGAADPISSVGEQFGQASINGVFSLTDALVPVPAATRASMAPVIPPVVLLLADLAIVSIALMVFIAALVYLKPLFRSRRVLGLGAVLFFIFLFLLGLGSVGLFILIGQSAQSGNVDDYLNLLSFSNSSYVAVDRSGASAEAISSMTRCAANITGQVRERMNKSVFTFSYAGKTCAWGSQANLSLESCLNKMGGQPIIYLHYNKTSAPPLFSVVYQKQADVWGDADYYGKCEIGDVLN